MSFFSRKGSSGQSSSFNLLIVALLLFGGGYLILSNSGRSMDAIMFRHLVTDETGTLTEDQKREIIYYSNVLSQRFGYGLKVKIHEQGLDMVEPDSRIIYIGLSPAHEEVVIAWPSVLKKALPEDFLFNLEHEHFQAYFEQDDWPQGLFSAMSRLDRELIKIERE